MATAAPVPELVFDASLESSEASSSDEVVFPARLEATAVNDSNVVRDSDIDISRYEANVHFISKRPHKLRKPIRPRSDLFQHSLATLESQNPAYGLNLPPTASSSQIARAIALAQRRMTADPDSSLPERSSSYLRISPGPSSDGSSTVSTFPSRSRSTSMTTPPPSSRPRKLSKPPPPDLPPIPPKPKTLGKSSKLSPPFSLKSDPVPPILSTSSDGISSAPIISISQPSSPVDLTTRDDPEYNHGTSDGVYDQNSSFSHLRSPRKRTTNLMRRWSVLEIPDDVLVAEMEEVRRVNKRKRTIRAKTEHHYIPTREKIASGAFIYGGPSPGQRLFWLGDDEEHEIGSDVEDSDLSDYDLELLHGLSMEGDEVEEEEWKKARRALFCCRELVRTEKNYFARLVQLLDGKTLTAPPVLLMTYLPSLIKASNTLLENFALDPTAYGVSKAFVDVEATLESALVAYCGVVGAIFSGKPEKRKLMRTSRRSSLIDRYSKSMFSGGTGEIMTNSPYNIEEHSLLEHPTPNGRRKTIPDFCSRDNLANHDQVEPDEKVEKGVKIRYAGTITRTKSLFKRKSMPPRSDIKLSPQGEVHIRPSSPKYASKAARTMSLINAFGLSLTGPPTPPPKPSPPPVPPKDVRPHTRSDPLPPRKAEPEKRLFPARPASSIGYSRSTSIHGLAATSNSSHDGKREKIPTVRDLAILPTQRVMRFVLLYKDLLEHTPNDSLTRPLVERALEGAVRIAGKCDRAQGNAAFLRRERP